MAGRSVEEAKAAYRAWMDGSTSSQTVSMPPQTASANVATTGTTGTLPMIDYTTFHHHHHSRNHL